MYYTVNLTVPANTVERDAVTHTLKLTRGTITAIQVGFPRGCYSLVHIQINDKGWQICPWTRSTDLAYSDYVFDMDYQYKLDTEPYLLTVKGWSEDDAFKHKIRIGIEFKPFSDQDYLASILERLEAIANLWSI